MVVEGRVGREEVVKYLVEHEALVGQWSQATLDTLEVFNLDYVTNILSTDAGGILEVYVHGHSTLVVLRPSTGSFVFSTFVREGHRGAMVQLATYHNAMVPIAKLRGMELSPFRVDTSLLANTMTMEGAPLVTKQLRSAGFISNHTLFATPMQIGGLWSPYLACALKGWSRADAKARAAEIAKLPTEAEREEAIIGTVEEALQPAMRALVGSIVGGKWSAYVVFELAGYDRAATRKLVDPIAAMPVAAARDAIGRLDEGLQSAARSLVGAKWSANAVFELAGYDRVATSLLLAPIAAMPAAEARDDAIGRLDEGLQSAAHSLVHSTRLGGKGQNSNSKDVFINVKDMTLGTTTLFYYDCSHAAAAYKLSGSLGVTCTTSSLSKMYRPNDSTSQTTTACRGLVTRSAETDREKATLLGEAQVLVEEYQKSDTYKKNVAAGARRKATFKDKQKTKGISKLV